MCGFKGVMCNSKHPAVLVTDRRACAWTVTSGVHALIYDKNKKHNVWCVQLNERPEMDFDWDQLFEAAKVQMI